MAAVQLIEQILHSFQGYCCSCVPMKLSEAQPAEVLQSNSPTGSCRQKKKAAVRMKSRLGEEEILYFLWYSHSTGRTGGEILCSHTSHFLFVSLSFLLPSLCRFLTGSYEIKNWPDWGAKLVFTRSQVSFTYSMNTTFKKKKKRITVFNITWITKMYKQYYH